MATIPLSTPASIQPSTTPRTSVLLGFRITFGGVLCLGIVTLVGLAALNSEANLLYLLTGISLAIVGISAILPLIMMRGIEVDRAMPDAVVSGRPFQITYVIRNRRRFVNAWGLLISERSEPRGSDDTQPNSRTPLPEAFAEVLFPGEEKRIEVMSICPERGRLALPGVRVMTRFPFGLFSCQVDFPLPAEVLVYPPIGRFRHDPWRDYRAASSSSNQALRNQSGHEEFYGVRDYRQGDNLRWIHWRRSARTGQLVVREMLPLKPTQLIVLVDPWPEVDNENPPPVRRSNRPPRSDIRAEMVISAAATALCDALERGYRAGLVCRAARPIVIPPAAGRTQRQRILHELATAQPGATEQLDAIVAQIRWSSGWHARCLVCTTLMREPHERVFKFLNTRAEALAILSPHKDDFFLLFEPRHDLAAGGRA